MIGQAFVASGNVRVRPGHLRRTSGMRPGSSLLQPFADFRLEDVLDGLAPADDFHVTSSVFPR